MRSRIVTVMALYGLGALLAIYPAPAVSAPATTVQAPASPSVAPVPQAPAALVSAAAVRAADPVPAAPVGRAPSPAQAVATAPAAAPVEEAGTSRFFPPVPPVLPPLPTTPTLTLTGNLGATLKPANSSDGIRCSTEGVTFPGPTLQGVHCAPTKIDEPHSSTRIELEADAHPTVDPHEQIVCGGEIDLGHPSFDDISCERQPIKG